VWKTPRSAGPTTESTGFGRLHGQALEACSDAGIIPCYNLLIFEPETRLDDVAENIAFMRRFAEHPVNFCRAEPYLGTPLHRQLAQTGSLSGSFLGWDYRLADDRAELLFRISSAAFRERNFASDGVANRYMGLNYSCGVLDWFYRVGDIRKERLRERAANSPRTSRSTPPSCSNKRWTWPASWIRTTTIASRARPPISACAWRLGPCVARGPGCLDVRPARLRRRRMSARDGSAAAGRTGGACGPGSSLCRLASLVGAGLQQRRFGTPSRRRPPRRHRGLHDRGHASPVHGNIVYDPLPGPDASFYQPPDTANHR